jgi:hypothetical protein
MLAQRRGSQHDPSTGTAGGGTACQMAGKAERQSAQRPDLRGCILTFSVPLSRCPDVCPQTRHAFVFRVAGHEFIVRIASNALLYENLWVSIRMR